VRRASYLLVALLTTVSCAKGTPTNPILPPGVSPTPLEQPAYVGIGKYRELAAVTMKPSFGGVPYVTFLEVRQPPESSVPHGDVPGFVYALQGSALISREGGENTQQQVIDQGTARWIDARSEHVNTSNTEQVWYLIALRSVAQRGAPLAYPNYKVLYSSGDLVTPPSDKQIVFQLGYLTMDSGGRTSSHSHGGTESFYVLKGTVELATNDGRRLNIAAGQGASVKPGVVMQLHLVGEQPVQILTFFVTPEGAPWQTNLQTLP